MKIKNLKDLLSPWISIPNNIDIKGIQVDSRLIKSKNLFLAINGEFRHGKEFIKDVIKKGVSAILCDTKNEKKHGKIVKYIDNIQIIYFFELKKNLLKISERY